MLADMIMDWYPNNYKSRALNNAYYIRQISEKMIIFAKFL